MRTMSFVLLILVMPIMAFAEDLYVGQPAAGFDDGSSCANAHAAIWFNNVRNWGAGLGTISAGDTVHFCGTITTNLIVQGNGSVGAPVTIVFETGAMLAPSVCGGSGCLNAANKSYIVVDGGSICGYIYGSTVACNGTVKNTAMQPVSSSFGIVADGCNNCEFKNLNIGPIYQMARYGTFPRGAMRGIQNLFGTLSGNTFKVHHNVITDVGSAIVYVPRQQDDNGFHVYNNYVYKINSSVDISNNNNGVLTAAVIHDNHFGSTSNWDGDGCPGHHNSFHAFAKIGSNGGTNSGIDYYNNLVDGYWGTCSTSGLFIEGGEYGANRNVRVWNNVFMLTYDVMNNGIVSLNGDGDLAFYNNTVVGSLQHGDVCVWITGVTTNAIKFKNNIVTSCNTLIAYRNITLADWDSNVYGGNAANPWTKQTSPPEWYSSLAAWRAASNKDQGAVFGASVSYVMLSVSGTLLAGSPAIGKAENLTSIGVPSLNRDRIGMVRVQTGPWDAGAYLYIGGNIPSAAPDGLRLKPIQK